MSAKKLLINLSKQSFPWMLLSVGLGFSGAIFNGVGTTLIIPIVTDFLGADILSFEGFPPVLRRIFTVFDGVPEDYRSLVMIGCVVLTIALKNLANYTNAVTSGVLGRRFTSTLRRRGFKLLLDVDLEYHAGARLGDLMNYINTEANRAANSVRALIRVLISSVTILVFLVMLTLISWQLTLLSTVLLGGVALINQVSMRQAKQVGRELSAAAAALSNRAIEVLSGIRLVKASASERAEYEALDLFISQRENAEYRSQLIQASVGPLNETMGIAAIVLLIILGRGFFAGQIEASASVILTYLVILFRMLPFIGQLNSARNQLANTAASVEILNNFLDRANKPIMQSGSQPFEGIAREICFKDIWFKYSSSDGWNLQDINLTIPKGQTLALVGASGAGKSTMADLLARFYDPSKGTLEIDGVDLRTFNLQSYRRRIGTVSQDTFLFNKSVRDNIRYGRESATDEEVFQAATLANAVEFIQQLPEGFDTFIGDRGVLLSGGQRQRIAIARALLQSPDVLILDEATSALDTVSEKLVQQALENLSRKRTTLVIAHRLSTVQNADQIAVLDQGKVVEVGTHEELLEKGAYYANLYSIQFAEEDSNSVQPSEKNGHGHNPLGLVSHEMRSQLNSMLAFFGFINNGESFDTSEEYEALSRSAYQSALSILRSLEEIEEGTVPNNN